MISGQIEGTALGPKFDELSGDAKGVAIATLNGDYWLQVKPSTATTSTISGIMATSLSGPFHGAVYCIDQGTYVYTSSEPLNARYEVSIQSLSKLGTCDGASGTDAILATCW